MSETITTEGDEGQLYLQLRVADEESQSCIVAGIHLFEKVANYTLEELYPVQLFSFFCCKIVKTKSLNWEWLSLPRNIDFDEIYVDIEM